MSKIMVLAAGRRRYVVEALRQSMPSKSSLLVADQSRDMPGLTVPGVQHVVEPTDAASFDDWLLETCEQHAIRGVLSLHDYQTVRASKLRHNLASIGTLWIGPAPQVATAMLDKVLLAEFLRDHDERLAIPTYSVGDRLPPTEVGWVVKDRLGSGSSGLVMGCSRESAQRAIDSDDVIAQPQVTGQEWNLDFFFWGDGIVRGISAKRKLRMRSGETDAAEVILEPDLPFKVSPVIDAFSDIEHLGNIDIDLFVGPSGVQVVDVNPRFGGGYAFSAKAGYRAADAVWALAATNDVQPFAVEAERAYTGAKSIEVVEL